MKIKMKERKKTLTINQANSLSKAVLKELPWMNWYSEMLEEFTSRLTDYNLLSSQRRKSYSTAI